MQALHQAFETVAAFARDTDLADGAIDRYQVGLFLREPTYCDASLKIEGFVARLRFLIVSSNGTCIDADDPDPRGLCIWPRGTIFKVIDRIEDRAHIQITLLEVPDKLLVYFCNEELNFIEKNVAEQARETFTACTNAKPVPQLNTDVWRARLVHPIGVDDDGHWFPLFSKDILANVRNRRTVRGVLRHQATILSRNQRYGEAEVLLQQALDLQSPPSTKRHVDRKGRAANRDRTARAADLHALARLYIDSGDDDRAEAAMLDAITLLKQVKGRRSELASCIHILGWVYQRIGEYKAAQLHYQHALEIKKKTDGNTSFAVVNLHCSLGALYEKWRKYDLAASHLAEAERIERASGHKPSLVRLNNVARLQRAIGQAQASLQTLKLVEAEAHYTGREQAALLFNLAEAYAAVQRPQDALARMQAGLAIDKLLIEDILSHGSERSVLRALHSMRLRMEQCISLVVGSFWDSQAEIVFVVNLILERKAASLDSLAWRSQVLRETGRPELHARVNELGRVRSEMARSRLAGPGGEGHDVHEERMRRAEARRDALESELASAVPVLRRTRGSYAATADAVVRALPAGSVLLEFVKYRPFEFAPTSETATSQPHGRYLAVVFSATASGVPRLVDLGDSETIDSLVGKYWCEISHTPTAQPSRDIDRSSGPAVASPERERRLGASLRAMVFDPLVGVVGDHVRIVIAPDAGLYSLAFDTLPTDDGGRLIDRYTISYVTTGRDLLHVDHSPAHHRPVVIASPEFDLADSDMSAPSTTVAPLAFASLDGARREGETVAALLHAEALLGPRALKTAVTQRAAPSVLHIATHGFALSEEVDSPPSPNEWKVGTTLRARGDERPLLVLNGTIATPTTFLDARRDGAPFVRLSGRDLGNPLLRSGLAFAGANTWLRGGTPPPEAEDGVLTAEEIACLNLVGTELVVLSACETGLGEARTGEGLFGLRRAFLLAGANNIVMSMWKIADKETCELMTSFYTRLLRGDMCFEALRGAQLEMKCRYPDPYFWGAFVCHGNPAAWNGNWLVPAPSTDTAC